MAEIATPTLVLQGNPRRVKGASPPMQAQGPRTAGLRDVVERNRAVRAIRQNAQPAPPSLGVGFPAGNAPGTRSVSPKTVVVIDDEPDQVDSTVMLLQSAGHTALGSTDGSEAVDLAAGAAADAVVLDFMLSNMNGADVCKALRAHPQTYAIKILFLSGTEEAEIHALCPQYDAYLRKPAAPLSLFEALQKL